MSKYTKVSDKYSYLSVKLSLISIIILSVIFSLYAYFSFKDLVSVIDGQYAERANSIIAMADTDITSKVNLDNPLYLQRICSKLMDANPDVMGASFYTMRAKGKVTRIAGNNSGQMDREAQAHYAALLKTHNFVWQEKSTSKEGHAVEVLAPIYLNGKADAVFGMYMDLKSKDLAINRYIARVVLYALLGLIALAPLLYSRFRKEVFHPLRELIEGTQEVAQGNLNKRVSLNRKDEIGKLSKEFDNMTEALQQREEETLCELERIKEKWSEAEEKSRTDFLTELDNHRSFHDRLEAELNRSARLGVPVSLLFCDLDKFKDFNDANGHLLGDRALFEIAEIIKISIRNYDVAARYGGEEFVVILPGANPEDAMLVAERIRHNVEIYGFTGKEGINKMTISIGIATFPGDARDKVTLIAAADHAMYESKKRGRNAVTLFEPSQTFNTGSSKVS